ncbi:MAG TPA: glycosyltransferase [Candidatus Hydrogenedentes bacterium]|nr:glycosyltransferase [Candidatus Hydrogenedentota bacterium]
MTGTPERLRYENLAKSAHIRFLLLRVIAAAVLVAAAVTANAPLSWAALLVLAYFWLFMLGRRLTFLRNLRDLHRLQADSQDGEHDALPGVTIIAPARNEAAVVEKAVRTLAALDYPKLETLVVNDHSTDATGAILDRIAAASPNVRVIHDPPVQEGWLGKANAIWYAVHQADPDNKWLLLADADVECHPKALRRAVAYAEAAKADFVTCIPRLENGSMAEELVIPSKWRALVRTAPLNRAGDTSHRALGIGAFTLVTRKAYLESGGHSAFYDEQPEDTLLAMLIKRCGGAMAVVWTSDMVRVRLYRGLKDLVASYTRKNRVVLDDAAYVFVSQALFHLLTTVFPLLFAVAMVAHQAARGAFVFPLAVSALIGLSIYYIEAKDYLSSRPLCRMRAITPWLHPIGGLLLTWIELMSIKQAVLKQSMHWRGRSFANVRTENPTTAANAAPPADEADEEDHHPE